MHIQLLRWLLVINIGVVIHNDHIVRLAPRCLRNNVLLRVIRLKIIPAVTAMFTIYIVIQIVLLLPSLLFRTILHYEVSDGS
jgi:hypothetical protein